MLGQAPCDQPDNRQIVGGKPYISVNSAAMNAPKALKECHSRFVRALKKTERKEDEDRRVDDDQRPKSMGGNTVVGESPLL
ncbi:MAG: hypothetical protein J2P48_02760 [Alphaproteobacteria bacterium]|nr:hypothetical protein [Alphaproteobacteria bacterium]